MIPQARPTSLSRLQGLNGRIVLVVFVGLLTGWALALLQQCQEYVPDHIQTPDNSDLVYRRRQILEFTHQSLLEQFYRELGVTTRRLDPTGIEPANTSELVVLLHPGAQAPTLLTDRLVDHVRAGGRLVVFTDTELDMLDRFGIRTVPAGIAELPATRAGASVDTVHVRTLNAPRVRVVASGERALVPLVGVPGQCVAGMVGYGKGSVTVVTERLADYAWIEQDDNAVFLANLVLDIGAGNYMARPSPVAILDYDAEVLRRLYALDAEANHRIEEARRRWQYDSLWSLIKANPVSAALIQLLLAILMFAMARARRLGDALPDHLARSEMPGTLEARANLFERSGAFRLAISRAVRHTNRWLTTRLGMMPDATAKDIHASLEATCPKAATRYASIVQFTDQVSEGKLGADDGSLAAIWNLIDALRRELPR